MCWLLNSDTDTVGLRSSGSEQSILNDSVVKYSSALERLFTFDEWSDYRRITDICVNFSSVYMPCHWFGTALSVLDVHVQWKLSYTLYVDLCPRNVEYAMCADYDTS